MSRRVYDRYPDIPTKRGHSLYQNSSSLSGGRRPTKATDESSSTGDTSQASSYGNPEHLETARAKAAKRSTLLRDYRTQAIETFREYLKLDSKLPHYKVLRILDLDYLRMKAAESEDAKLTDEQLQEFIDYVNRTSHSHEWKQSSESINE